MTYNIVYKTTNLLNSKIYVGKHTQEGLEFDGYLGSGTWITRVIEKYGKENFVRETIEVVNSEVSMNEREIFWIAELKAQDPEIGYNLTPGGDGWTSEMFKAKWQEPEYREAQLKRLQLLWNDDFIHENHSIIMKEKWQDEEWAIKQTKLLNSDDAKNKTSISHKLLWQEPEYRENGLKILREVQNRPEVKVKMALAQKTNWENEEYRKKQLEYINSSESIEKKSQSMMGNRNGAQFDYILKDSLGKLWEISCLAEFCREHKLNKSKIYQVVSGKRKQHKGWTKISRIAKADKNIQVQKEL